MSSRRIALRRGDACIASVGGGHEPIVAGAGLCRRSLPLLRRTSCVRQASTSSSETFEPQSTRPITLSSGERPARARAAVRTQAAAGSQSSFSVWSSQRGRATTGSSSTSDDLLEEKLRGRQRPLGREGRAERARDRGRADRDRLAGLERLRHGRRALGLDAVDASMPGRFAFRAAATPAMKPPPPIETKTWVRSGGLQELEPERAVAGDDRRIVVGMDEEPALSW